MSTRIIHEKQDLKYLQWSQIRSSSGTAGSFLKATDVNNPVSVSLLSGDRKPQIRF